MKPSEILIDIGRPVAYYPGLRRIAGSATATIFLCQFLYWTGKEKGGDGWIYKTSDEIEEETALSYEEQKTARRRLVENGLLKETNARLEHKMYFRIDLDRLDLLWRNGEPPVPEQGNATLGNKEMPCSYNSNTENTTETTSHTLSEKKKIQGIESAILQGRPVTREDLKVSSSSWKDHIPAGAQELLFTYADLTGQQPLKGDISDWVLTGDEWLQLGATIDDIKKAHAQSKNWTTGRPTRPGSLTKTIGAMAGERRVKRKPPSVESLGLVMAQPDNRPDFYMEDNRATKAADEPIEYFLVNSITGEKKPFHG
jgi:hypothetical protein